MSRGRIVSSIPGLSRFGILVLTVLLAGGASAATITVTSTADTTANDGVCTLREAIIAANTNTASGAAAGECAAGQVSPTVDTIAFNIAGAGLHTIAPGTQLPDITEVVVVDGGNAGVASNRVEISGGATLGTGLALSGAGANNSEIRNLVINGFASTQILVVFVTNSTIRGNILGLNAAGTAIVAGSGFGVDIAVSGGTHVIGGTTAAARNVVSSAANNAIQVDGSNATIQGNFIGLNASGTAAVGSPGTGVGVSNASATIGGTTPGAGNVIAAFTGIRFGGNPALGHSTGTVQGNLIGTDVTGTVALNLGNGSGVDIDHATGVVISDGNVISGNGDGVTMHSSGVSGATSDSTVVRGNFIGTAADGVTALGNSRNGVDIFITNNNTIGGTSSAQGNVIAFNGQTGVRNGIGTNNAILGNSIFANGKLGIDLAGGTESLAGVTSNDAGDADTGPNNLQNYPVITSAPITAGIAAVSGTLDSTASTTFRLEFFASATCDPSGNGEGQTFLGAVSLPTNGSGNLAFGPLPFAVPSGQSVITATATDPTNNTSEFSACLAAPPPPTLSINGVSANEGNSATTPFTFTVTLSAPSASTVTVNFATADGTATAGSDYTATSGMLTFAPGQTTQPITVNVNGDTAFEPNETFFVNLSAPGNATIATGTGTGLIVNDDVALLPTLSVNNVSANEGNSGTTPFTFTVTLSAPSASTVTVTFTTADATAAAGSDYVAASGTLTFAPGQTTQPFTVNVIGDTAVEPNETFFVNLSGPSNATIAEGSGTGTIVNDDVAPLPTLSINNVSANEGNSGTTPFTFTVTLSAPSASTVTVNFATADGSANAGSDYGAASGTLTFAPGQTTQPVTVNVIGDTAVEASETFLVSLAAPTNATIATALGTGTILNDDAPPPVANPVIPTLSDWMLAALAMLLAALAVPAVRLRRR